MGDHMPMVPGPPIGFMMVPTGPGITGQTDKSSRALYLSYNLFCSPGDPHAGSVCFLAV